VDAVTKRKKGVLTMKRIASMLLIMLVFAVTVLASETLPPHPAEVTPDPWPKMVMLGTEKYTIYQPQLESWNHFDFIANAAVSVQADSSAEPQFGVITIAAQTLVDRASRTVQFQNITVSKAFFPSAPGRASVWQNGFQSMLASGPSSMSLDRLEAALAIKESEIKARTVPVMNMPPGFIFSQSTSILINVDGEPVWRRMDGTSCQRLLNSRALIFKEPDTGRVYLHLYDGFLSAPAIHGPWTVAERLPEGIARLAEQLGKDRTVDLLQGQADSETGKFPSLKLKVPQVFVTSVPTELIITNGAPDWQPLDGTMLLYVKNTTANIFKDMNNQKTYLLVTGRWFVAPGFSGPWEYLSAKKLPADFSRIPDDSPKENVKASVPGTVQAKEALIAAQIPQTATVDRTKLTFTPLVNGQPELKPIPNSGMMYVVNAPNPLIMVNQNQWYALYNGIWFFSTSLHGPWSVASSIPAVIYSIPPSSPLHYVTYVKIYAATPTQIVVGYTPGYLGSVISADGLVIYGTGYTYAPYISTTVWYAPPVTYGYAANVSYTPWTGWAVGFGFGWGVSSAWGPAPYWGPYGAVYGYHGYAPVYGYHGPAAVWGPGGWAATSGNVYQHWGTTSAVSRSASGYNAWTGNAWSSKVGMSYNSTNGRISAGQSGTVTNVYNGNTVSGQRGYTYNPTTGVAARGGSVTGTSATGKQNSAEWGKVAGPGGQTASGVKINNNYYGDHNGNVYKYNATTGTAQKYNSNGSWSTVDKPTTQSLQSQSNARGMGDSKAAASSWGSNKWGGGFEKPAVSSPVRTQESGWDRGGSRETGAERSWGGGGFHGGGFHGRR
jgi:hypothetical protein